MLNGSFGSIIPCLWGLGIRVEVIPSGYSVYVKMCPDVDSLNL